MQIKVYCRNGEPYSDMLKNILKYYSVEYENIEVSRDNESFAQLVEISGQESTPVLVVDGKAFVGFDREQIKKILNLPEDQSE